MIATAFRTRPAGLAPPITTTSRPGLDGERKRLSVVARGQHHVVSPVLEGAHDRDEQRHVRRVREVDPDLHRLLRASSSPASARKAGAVVQRTNGTRFVTKRPRWKST